MADGIRIKHPTMSDVVLVIPHPGNPETGRQPKDYFVKLDSEGYAIVSETVWGRLQESAAAIPHPNNQWLLVNTVAEPPTLLVGNMEAPTMRVLEAATEVEREPFAPPVEKKD